MGELLDDIVTGAVPPAAWLPRIDDIAARHACSLSTAREAIRALEERRVVAVHAGQGQQVLGAERWALLDGDVLDAAVVRHRDPQLLREAVAAFRALEIEAAKLAAPRVTAGDLALLERTLDQMRGSTHDRGFADAEARFHQVLVSVSGNRVLAGALEALHPALARVRRRTAADRDPVVVRLHAGILAALAERDAAAAAAAVESYGRHLKGWLRV